MTFPKVLFICSPEPDYLQDLTVSGLQKVLGPENVIDYPWNKAYHFPLRKYPRNLGYNGIRISFPSAVRPNLLAIDLVVLGSCKPIAFENYISIANHIPAKVPVVFIDGGDYDFVGGDLERLGNFNLLAKAQQIRPFDLIFKREKITGRDYGKNVLPFPFSFNFRHLPPIVGEIAPKYQVSFWAVESDLIRTKALDLLSGQFDCASNGTTRNQVFSKYKRKGLQYLHELAACKITINLRGVGYDTMRYWEAPAVGSLMISAKPKIEIPNNFIDREEVVFCNDDLSNLIELCNYYLENNQARKKIIAAAYGKLKFYHTDTERARYLLETIGFLV